MIFVNRYPRKIRLPGRASVFLFSAQMYEWEATFYFKRTIYTIKKMQLTKPVYPKIYNKNNSMKNQLISFCLVIALFISACSKDNNSNNNVNPSDGTWRVTLFTDSGNDETSDFNGYTFAFGSNGVLTVSGGSSKTGAWSQTSSNFNIDLGEKSDANKPLGELTDNWDIISISATEIKLQDDNPASAEFLTFKKN